MERGKKTAAAEKGKKKRNCKKSAVTQSRKGPAGIRHKGMSVGICLIKTRIKIQRTRRGGKKENAETGCRPRKSA